ncbi:High-affinity methionine permease [Psilocybe cubensis]|uniref:High-affinity methionine permease n=1 Tax=Psilocybe cubensis TaxID=181762 RepID=A0ACB8GPK5_PSICU|nr:High-affinity methionine permease [Psilocybe cubensis]KAH9477578.1 High-affinity methionine permease [Psilocybe cubensis]
MATDYSDVSLVNDSQRLESSEHSPLLSSREPRSDGLPRVRSALEGEALNRGDGDLRHGESYDNVPKDKRQLGLFSVAFLIFNRIIGTGIYATPSNILRSSGSVGVSLIMWLVGASIAACGTAVYVELGTGLPRSGGEKNYLEFIYRRPNHFQVREGYEKPDNFKWEKFWEGSGTGLNAFVSGVYNVIWSFVGYSNANYALSEVRDPVRTIRRAAPLAMLAVTSVYVFINIAYFAVVSKSDILESRRIVAALYFRNLFGPTTEKTLSSFIAISTLGNLLSGQFSQGRGVEA